MNSKVQRIIIIVAVALASIVALSFISLAIIRKDFNPNLNAPARIIVYNNNDYQSCGKGSKEYNKIMGLYNDSFQTSLLDAMLQGKSGIDSKLVGSSYKNLNSITSSSSTYLEFFYNSPQTLEKSNLRYDDLTYVSVIIEVYDTDTLSQINMYVRFGGSGTNTYSYVRFVTYAAQCNLYDYITNL